MTFIQHLEESGIILHEPVAVVAGVLNDDDNLTISDGKVGRLTDGLPESLMGTEYAEGFDNRYDFCIVWDTGSQTKSCIIYSMLDGANLVEMGIGGVMIVNSERDRIIVTQNSDTMNMALRIQHDVPLTLHS